MRIDDSNKPVIPVFMGRLLSFNFYLMYDFMLEPDSILDAMEELKKIEQEDEKYADTENEREYIEAGLPYYKLNL